MKIAKRGKLVKHVYSFQESFIVIQLALEAHLRLRNQVHNP